MPERLARYGLEKNPFYHQLNPLEDAVDVNRFASVGSFGQVLGDIDRAVTEAIKKDEGVFILITGGSGSGRTAVANYALARYRDARNIAAKDFFVVVPIPNNSPGHVLRQALNQLSVTLQKKGPSLETELLKSLRNESTGLLSSEVLVDALGNRAFDVADALKKNDPTSGFGVFIKGIPDAAIFSAAHGSFQMAETIIVMTGTDAILPVGDAAKCRYALTSVATAEAPTVLEQRWKHFAPATVAEIPFTPGAVQKAFKGPNPIERILVLFGQILDSRINNSPKGETWPKAAELELDEDFVSRQADSLSRDWRGM